MKFSSISLTAAALAAILGSALAAPGPLYMRALEQINSFGRDLDVFLCESEVAVLERDIDGEPVDGSDLFIRSVTVGRHQVDHSSAVRAIQVAIDTGLEAARQALKAYEVLSDPDDKQYWLHVYHHHRDTVQRFLRMRGPHAHAATLSRPTELHAIANQIETTALRSTQDAQETIEKADHAIAQFNSRGA